MKEKEEYFRLDCKLHGRVDAKFEEKDKEIKNLQESDSKQWDVLDELRTSKADAATVKTLFEEVSHKASWGHIKWLFGLLIPAALLLAIATVGFLWKQQTSSRNEILTEVHKMNEILGGENGLKQQIQRLTWTVDQHIKDSNDNGKNKGSGGKQ